ncbi:MAG: hypothetical protein WKF54_05970 [Nocardioidaceae bacterium]
MGWVILVVVVLALVSSLGNRSKRRRRMPMTPFPPQMMPGQATTPPMPPAPFPLVAPVPQVGPVPQVVPAYEPDDATYLPSDRPISAPMPPVPSRPRVDTQPSRPARYQGSTALAGSALNTSLATPYQPSSLLTSLSSSLSSSATDTPPKLAPSSVFGQVSAIALPDGIATQVRFHLRNGHEVEAVRLVCHQLDVGLLEATKTVRSYGDGS